MPNFPKTSFFYQSEKTPAPILARSTRNFSQIQFQRENTNFQNSNRLSHQLKLQKLKNQPSHVKKKFFEKNHPLEKFLDSQARKVNHQSNAQQIHQFPENFCRKQYRDPRNLPSRFSLTPDNRIFLDQLKNIKIKQNSKRAQHSPKLEHPLLTSKRSFSKFSNPFLTNPESPPPRQNFQKTVISKNFQKSSFLKRNVGESYYLEIKIQPWLAMNYPPQQLENFLNEVSKRLAINEPCLASVQFKKHSELEILKTNSQNSLEPSVRLPQPEDPMPSDDEATHPQQKNQIQNAIMLNILEIGYLGKDCLAHLQPFRQQIIRHTFDSFNIFKIQDQSEAQKAFFKYINLQIPLPQNFFIGIELGWRTKALCYVFCKSFKKKNLFRLFENFWEDIPLGDPFKSAASISKL